MDSSNAKSQQDDLIAARRYLRKLQVKGALNKGAFTLNQPDKTELTIQALRLQRQLIQTDDPAVVKRGVFMFDPTKERERIMLAEVLIRRVDPGPFEDPNFLALLAYQAASVESVLLGLLREKAQERLSKFLLGTVHSAIVEASARTLSKHGFTIVALNSGLVDFIYQAAKAVIEASNPARPASGNSAVVATVDLKIISDGLSKNSAPIDRVWKTLEAYFFKGYPRAHWNESVKEEFQPPLDILISMAERSVIAHEYGHNLAMDFSWAPRPVNDQDIVGNRASGPQNPRWAIEFFADTQGTILTVLSAANLDGLPPELSLSGVIFAFACLDILEKTLTVLRTGDVSEVTESNTHPPWRTRGEATIVAFRRFFDVEYHEGGAFDLNLVLRKETPLVHSFSSERSEATFLYANVLLKIWDSVKDILVQQFLEKRPLHPMWR